MTRATRVVLGSTILFITYLLALFAFIPVPFFSKAHTEQILPVVSPVVVLPSLLDT
jgi:hypothetical protein